MKMFARTFTPFFLVFALFLVSCVEDKDYGEANTLRPEVNTNVEVTDKTSEDSIQKLETLINMPVEAEETDFRLDDIQASNTNSRVPGPQDRMLTVVLKYSEENAEKLSERLSEFKEFDIEIEAETWFPAELKAKADAEGDQKIKGKGTNAKIFGKAPFLKGTILRIPETNFFVLRMSTN